MQIAVPDPKGAFDELVEFVSASEPLGLLTQLTMTFQFHVQGSFRARRVIPSNGNATSSSLRRTANILERMEPGIFQSVTSEPDRVAQTENPAVRDL